MKDFRKMTDYQRDRYFEPPDWTLTTFKVMALGAASLMLWGLFYGAVSLVMAGIAARFVIGG